MCSIPRSSGSARKVHQLAINKTDFESYSQMMRRASDVYEQRQEEHAIRRGKLAQKSENNKLSIEQSVIDTDGSTNKIKPVVKHSLKKYLNQFIFFMKKKIYPIVIN
jgi:dephospho-CoA kinase